MTIETRLAELGITLPEAAAPVASYVPYVEANGMLHVSGQISFAEDGSLRVPGYVTVMQNGVVVQNHAELQGPTEWIGYPSYKAHDCAPIKLQDHDADVSYRNIWIRPL